MTRLSTSPTYEREGDFNGAARAVSGSNPGRAFGAGLFVGFIAAFVLSAFDRSRAGVPDDSQCSKHSAGVDCSWQGGGRGVALGKLTRKGGVSAKKSSGDFLTVFAEAVLRADFENFAILQDAAEALIRKYSLGGKYPEHKPNHDEMQERRPS